MDFWPPKSGFLARSPQLAGIIKLSPRGVFPQTKVIWNPQHPRKKCFFRVPGQPDDPEPARPKILKIGAKGRLIGGGVNLETRMNDLLCLVLLIGCFDRREMRLGLFSGRPHLLHSMQPFVLSLHRPCMMHRCVCPIASARANELWIYTSQPP